MSRIVHCTLLAALIVLPAGFAPAAEPPAGELDLLNPPSGAGIAAGWVYFSGDAKSRYEDVWTMTDGVLVCKGKPLGYIYTRQSYANFVLRLQWRIPAEAQPHKGGVLVRTTGKHKIWPKSLEAQINHPDAGDFWGLDGYTLDGPAQRKKTLEHEQFGMLVNLKKAADAEKPLGQWNQYEIVAEGNTVTLVINGRQVNRATGCQVVPGPICLTAEGNEIHFRDVKLLPRD